MHACAEPGFEADAAATFVPLDFINADQTDLSSVGAVSATAWSDIKVRNRHDTNRAVDFRCSSQRKLSQLRGLGEIGPNRQAAVNEVVDHSLAFRELLLRRRRNIEVDCAPALTESRG